MDAVIYARYSCDLQNPKSADNQISECEELIKKNGWHHTGTFQDRAMSGAREDRPGFLELIENAERHSYDVVVAESLSRICRDEEIMYRFFKIMIFNNVSIYTLLEGSIDITKVAIHGIINATYSRDLSETVKLRMKKAVEQGKHIAPPPTGYFLPKLYDEDGNRITGSLEIDEAEKDIVIRIFNEYASGLSAATIIQRLNVERIPTKLGNEWSTSSILGNYKRGTGIINNRLYIGDIVYRRTTIKKHPITKIRKVIIRPESEQVVHHNEKLRIIPQALWDKVREVKVRYRKKTGPRGRRGFWSARRPKYLLSGKLFCGACMAINPSPSKYTIISRSYGCARADRHGNCNNHSMIKRDDLERTVLYEIEKYFKQNKIIEDLCLVYNKSLKAHLNQEADDVQSAKKKLPTLNTQLRNCAAAIAINSNLDFHALTEKIQQLEMEKKKVEEAISRARPKAISSTSSSTKGFLKEFSSLRKLLDDKNERQEAFNAIRSLIEKIVITPDGDILLIDIFMSSTDAIELGAKENPELLKSGAQVKLVAGVRIELTASPLPRG